MPIGRLRRLLAGRAAAIPLGIAWLRSQTTGPFAGTVTGACSTLHRAKGVIWAAAGYQIIARSACVLAPRQSYGSTGIKSLVVTPTLKAASAGRHLPLQGGSDSARNLILRAPET